MFKMKNIYFCSVETRHGTSLQCIASLRIVFSVLFLFTATIAFAQAPAGYYAAAEGKSGEMLRTALHNIIKTHSSVSYSELWLSFQTTDVRPDNGKVWDMYSDRPGGTPSYYFTFISDQCGNYSGEGDCYNREHSVPKSWFGGSVAPMYTDLFHLIPTDGFVNSKRSNLPIGQVTNATWTSTNGSKVGTSNISGYSGQVFEPIDSFKGDFARIYFYMATCYKDKNLGVETLSNFSGGDLKPWAKTLLLQWAVMDPVSQKEIDRNNAVYALQHNRNPYVDYPELVGKVFGADSVNAFHYGSAVALIDPALVAVYPNPTHEQFTIQSNSVEINEIVIFDLMGKEVLHTEALNNHCTINVSQLPAGLYLLKIHSENQTIIVKKLVIQ